MLSDLHIRPPPGAAKGAKRTRSGAAGGSSASTSPDVQIGQCDGGRVAAADFPVLAPWLIFGAGLAAIC
jgi:hypothetical protein